MQVVYPDLYRVDDLTDEGDNVIVEESEDGEVRFHFWYVHHLEGLISGLFEIIMTLDFASQI